MGAFALNSRLLAFGTVSGDIVVIDPGEYPHRPIRSMRLFTEELWGKVPESFVRGNPRAPSHSIRHLSFSLDGSLLLSFQLNAVTLWALPYYRLGGIAGVNPNAIAAMTVRPPPAQQVKLPIRAIQRHTDRFGAIPTTALSITHMDFNKQHFALSLESTLFLTNFGYFARA